MKTAKKLKITEGSIPDDSLISHYLPSDYFDVYECHTPDSGNLTPDNLLIDFWTAQPQWITFLFRVRDALVKPFGVNSGKDESKERLIEAIRSGGNYKSMSLPQKNDRETVMQIKDKHLTAELSIYVRPIALGEKTIKVITTTHFHNSFGKFYFFMIKPFHKIVAKAMIKSSVKRLSQ